jgi:geranylgeranyl diphosphate synthase type I
MLTKASFKQQLVTYKQSIDARIAHHIQELQAQTAQSYTPASAVVVDAYCQVLARGGKRIRGALTLVGYDMCGGTDTALILDAACAIEMTHAYILVLDDIMDKSTKRRGGDSAHTILAKYHTDHGLSGDSYHFGEAAAINSALIGCHYAQNIVATLNGRSEYIVRALTLLNESLVVTGHGQINDIFNEVVESVDQETVDKVLEWKTAHYTFLNPLQFGMALAGATEQQVNAIRTYCMHAGRAFQITDDILGTFASEQEAGKSPMDDIREGKRTVLSVVALENAQSSDKSFLQQMLGNEYITTEEFTRCKEIIRTSGALQEAEKQAATHIETAKASLVSVAGNYTGQGSEFLSLLVDQLLGRTI